jgi:hypothetical protein
VLPKWKWLDRAESLLWWNPAESSAYGFKNKLPSSGFSYSVMDFNRAESR